MQPELQPIARVVADSPFVVVLTPSRQPVPNGAQAAGVLPPFPRGVDADDESREKVRLRVEAVSQAADENQMTPFPP
ncbi:unnamed protein product [Urochloa humidicola]